MNNIFINNTASSFAPTVFSEGVLFFADGNTFLNNSDKIGFSTEISIYPVVVKLITNESSYGNLTNYRYLIASGQATNISFQMFDSNNNKLTYDNISQAVLEVYVGGEADSGEVIINKNFAKATLGKRKKK